MIGEMQRKAICNIALVSDVCSRAGIADGGGLLIGGRLSEPIQGPYTSTKKKKDWD